MKNNKWKVTEMILLLAGGAVLVVLQLWYTRPPFFDEDEYLGNVALLHQYGFGSNYLLHLNGSAGPLYSMVHFLFEPLTGLHTPQIRLLNTGFLLGAVYFIYRTLLLLNKELRFFSLYMLAIPMTYIIGGLALTEAPALLFFSCSTWLIIKNTQTQTSSSKLLQLAVAGLCMGFAILGRQPYLLTVAATPLLFLPGSRFAKEWLPMGITLLFSIALPCYVFYIWNGLVPSIESQLYKDIAAAGTPYRLDFSILCLFYFAVCMLLIAPGFFSFHYSKKTTIVAAACLLLLVLSNYALQGIFFLPAKTLVASVIRNELLLNTLSGLFGGIVIFLALHFIVCIYLHFKNRPFNKELAFFIAALLLIAVSCAKITTGYSSLYAAQGAGLLVLCGSYFYKSGRYNRVLIVLGMVTGLSSLISYFAGI